MKMNLDRIMSLMQLVMSVFMLLSLIVWGIGHLIMGTIGLFGLLVVGFFTYLIWTIVRVSWTEYKQEKNK